MNERLKDILIILAIVIPVIGLYGGLLAFLTGSVINLDNLLFNIKLLYFLQALLFGGILVLYIIMLTSQKEKKNGRKK